METLRPRERRHQRTQQAILDAARAIVREHGIDGLTIRAIADRIEYSPAGLYEYYGGKDEIIGALCLQGFQRLTQYLASPDPTLPPLDYLVECGMSYIAFAREDSDLFLLIFTNAPLLMPETLPPSVTAGQMLMENSAFMTLYRAVERCVEASILPSDRGLGVFELALTAWQMVHGVAMLNVTILKPLPVDPTQARRGLMALMLGLQQEVETA
jgi:AcrR family transcriptional regulator